ncbi:MAG: RNA polymerase-associated protein RapA [Gammaproteobacteria bacterium]|jgi:ATP-dependent helicase HepA|nr:RNA polymerase-associated protein RapA [Gammaproteobacteria bacterium]MBT5204385.1 RNA polymerase-associated protein RapA [Gammaproteobacteria bacterium]MBT5603700.1 RNA polymerase-associated protein RapA [Gammaproteobacteria bacterium]
MTVFKPGQRWISTAEPDLGLAEITQVGSRQLECFFEATDTTRMYAIEQAPLVRVLFQTGDLISVRSGAHLLVDKVTEQDGLLTYHTLPDGRPVSISEKDLDPNLRFSKPQDRLFSHQIDDHRWFNLRYQSLVHKAEYNKQSFNGLLGPRTTLIPHQLYIAHEVAARYAPRVLLADEVGLGKTIEAGLVMHQQLHTGRAQRVLIIVPAALTFQWFIEMIRRFNIQFSILDEDRCQQIVNDNRPEAAEESEPYLSNPFDAQQLVLCNTSLFEDNPQRLQQASSTHWDLLIVDEAHHLHWSEDHASQAYQAVESIAQAAKGLLLLTATPEQFGMQGHFARLRLLDPHRYQNFQDFKAEQDKFADTAALVEQLEDPDPLISGPARQSMIKSLARAQDLDDDRLIRRLLDQHGTGRVLFRNVRSSISGFPSRKLHTYPLKPPGRLTPVANTEADQLSRNIPTEISHKEPRTVWLLERLQHHPEKHLVICSDLQTAIDLDQHLRRHGGIRSTCFHEGLDLIARDRAANYFSDSEQGAQILVCSEIGSEGRNFQFASHLVMFDLPMGADLVEQRIGRLDRIGQQNDVHIHIPLIDASFMSKLFQWYYKGLDLFSQPNPAAQGLFEDYIERFLKIDIEHLPELIDSCKLASQQRLIDLSQGRNKLLERSSFNKGSAAAIIAGIEKTQNSTELQTYLDLSFELFDLTYEDLGNQINLLKPTRAVNNEPGISAGMKTHYTYPDLPEEGLRYTTDRNSALSREDVAFLTWEHPLVEQAIDKVLSETAGNSSVVVVKHPDMPVGTLLLEIIHSIECLAPGYLGLNQFMSTNIVRTVISPDLRERSDQLPFDEYPQAIAVPEETIFKIIDSQQKALDNMLKFGQQIADERLLSVIDNGLNQYTISRREELNRLTALAEINPAVRKEEIQAFEDELQQGHLYIKRSKSRLEAIRVIIIA